MNYKKVFWGAILVILGVLLILKNTGIIFFSWYSIWHLWPVLLILWGISLLPIRDYIKLIVSILLIILSLVFLYKNDDYSLWHWHFGKDSDNDIPGLSSQSLNEPFDSTTRIAVLNFEAAAGAFKITDTTGKLIAFERRGETGLYSMEIQKSGDSSIINLKMRDSESDIDTRHGNKVDLKLNVRPEWELKMDVGAASVDFDLTKFKMKNIEIEGGASSINLKIGAQQKMTKIDLSSGASSIKILIPKTAACEVNSSSFMSSKHLDGLTKQEDGVYRTDNFKTSTQKIIISLESAISSLSVERY